MRTIPSGRTLFSSTHIEANRSLNTRFIYDFAVPSQFGIPITAQIPGETTISVSNGFTTGGSGAANPGYFNTLTYSGAQDFTWVHGKHQLQFGAQFIRAYMRTRRNTRGVNGNLQLHRGSSPMRRIRRALSARDMRIFLRGR